MQGKGIFKGIFAISGCALVGMLYWSSLLQENNIKKVRQEIKELHAEMASLGQKISRELHNFQAASDHLQGARTAAASEYPNLLKEDPYYAKTVPKLLGEQFDQMGSSIAL